ncbi:MAG: leucyl/phenylalanyl-tRNA--protein transferase [Syntrophobacterales bacterium]|nr:leucyl/phenylalanyl-tRNA--protein transferase [Syntrophobacterales bacterium]
MTVFWLGKEVRFPHPELADPDGLLAVGGDLSPRRLLVAYSLGIFPWYDGKSPILWWSPDPRLVLFPEKIKISHSLKRVIKKGIFRVSMDKAFSQVIRECASVRIEKNIGTWITPEMIEAYEMLHNLGYAHSVETWHEGQLVGGLYGVSLGRAFFGESMFSRMKDASKVALVFLARILQNWEFTLIDCQVSSKHLIRMGAEEIPRKDFLHLLDQALSYPSIKGNWYRDFQNFESFV